MRVSVCKYTFLCTHRPASPGFVQHIMPSIYTDLCINNSLDTWTVVFLTNEWGLEVDVELGQGV
jgi:hypothetical protein